jgi:hypothetical protein
MCNAYGSGTISKDEYSEERDALAKLQVAVIEKEAGQNLTTPAAKTTSPDQASLKKPSSPDVKETSSKSTESAASKNPQAPTTSGKPDKSKEPPTEEAKPNGSTAMGPEKGSGRPGTSQMPTPKPVPTTLDPHYEGLFMQYQGDEAMLTRLGEEAFSRLDYAWTIKFLEQARTVQSSKAWERDFPYLAAAYLLGNGDRDRFQSELQSMLAEMRLNNSFLHHSAPIGMTLQNLSNVRQYVDKSAQEYIDNQIVPEAIKIKQNV